MTTDSISELGWALPSRCQDDFLTKFKTRMLGSEIVSLVEAYIFLYNLKYLKPLFNLLRSMCCHIRQIF